MSFTQNDRKLRSKSGKTFPKDPDYHEKSIASVIGAALKTEFGGSPASVKMIVRMTGRNERAVRNWFDGTNGPNGENLVMLMRSSSHGVHAVLRLAGREDLARAGDLSRIREQMRALVQAMDDHGAG